VSPQRAASSTAVLVCQGRACADGRFAVSRFADPIAWDLLDPDERAVVDDVRAGRVPTQVRQRWRYEMVRACGTVMVARTVAIDDAIREHAADQVVILGAGLDARAWRMPELARASVFEVDHPASQQDKLRRLADRAPSAGRMAAVALDLAADPLAPALEGAGFDPARPTTWVWEGVIPYLSPAEVDATVAAIAQLSAPGSRLAVNYQSASRRARVLRQLLRPVLSRAGVPDPLAGEPWRSLWRPGTLAQLVAGHGFAVGSDRDLVECAAGLDLPPGATGSMRNGRVAVADLPG